MANLPAALAAKVGEARTAGGGAWLQHGAYVLMVKNWSYTCIQSECVIAEFIAVKSEKKTVYEGSKPVTQEPNPLGSECSEVANFSGAGKLSAPSNARAVVLGLFGFKEGDVPAAKVAETLTYVTSDAQPATGMLIGCSTFAKEIRSKKGEYITGRNWTCIDKPGEGLNAPALVQARLAALKISADECVRVTTEQMRGTTHATATVDAPALTPPVTAPTATIVAAPPAPPAPAAPTMDTLQKALAAGWQRHPQNPSYYFKDSLVKPEADLLAGNF